MDYILIGDASEYNQAYARMLRQQIQQLGLEDMIHFAGAVKNDQVAQWYLGCFVHINSSSLDYSMDKSALEAMACGKPSLSLTIGFTETFGRWSDWLLFRHKDPEDLARKLNSYYC